MKTTFFIFALCAAPVLAATEDNLKEIFQSHKGIMAELSNDYIDSSDAPSSDIHLKNERTTLKASSKKAKASMATEPSPQNYTFLAKTVWANVTVHLTDFHNHFKIAVESDSPVDGWIVKKASSQQVVSRGGENEAFNFAFDVNEVFSQDYTLTVLVNKDGETNPALVPLRN